MSTQPQRKSLDGVRRNTAKPPQKLAAAKPKLDTDVPIRIVKASPKVPTAPPPAPKKEEPIVAVTEVASVPTVLPALPKLEQEKAVAPTEKISPQKAVEKPKSQLPKSATEKHIQKRKLWYLAPLGLLSLIAIAGLALVFVAVVSGISQYRKLQAEPIPTPPAVRDLAALAKQQQSQGDIEGAAETLTKIVAADSSNIDASAQLAVIRYRLKQYQQAVDAYTKLAKTESQTAFAWNGIGNTYRDWSTSDTDMKDAYEVKAIDAYLQAIRANSTYVAAYSNLAQLYIQSEKTDLAKKLLDEGILNTKSSTLQELRNRIK